MTVFPIRLFGDPVLRTPAAAVDVVDDGVRKLIDDMFETMRVAPGVGLAAPQIGVSRRIIVWEFEERSGALINPEIVAAEGEITDEEGCLSLPGLAYPVARARSIKVTALDPEGKPVEFKEKDWVARILQHEIDHVNGVLFIDRLPDDLRRQAKRKLMDQALGAPVADAAERM